MKLIIAEKPAVAFSIAKALNIKGSKDGYIENKDFVISWCVGHLVALAEPSVYDEKYAKWNYADLPIIPAEFQYKIYGGKQKQFKVIKSLMNRKDVTEVINACDAGREGELIFRLVYNQANCRKPVKRLWISSMEESAIRGGFENLKDGSAYDNLYQSALCRLWADWLVGINATRLFSLLYRKTLNIGRVQTPTLALLCDRHNKISFFKKEKYFTVFLDLGSVQAETERIDNEDTAKEIAAACGHSQAVCVSVTKEQKTEKPPKLFDLTALQRAANRLYGYTAKQTLDLAQSLYEKKLITYPRTDSRYLTEDMARTVLEVIACSLKLPPFADLSDFHADTFFLFNNEKVSDHHAIIPTMELGRADLSALPNSEQNLLNLIIDRLLASSAQPYVYENTTAIFECGGHTFTAKGKSVIDYGFKAIEKLLDTLSENADNNNQLFNFTEGQTFSGVAEIQEKYTVPPKPYTEDTLLSAMETAGVKETTDDAERKGLGTPATRAAILEKLVQTGFAERKGKQILPTKTGTLLISVLPDTLISPSLTAEWENALALISKGQENPKAFMQGIETMITGLVERYKAFNGKGENPFQKESGAAI
ncbi:MAG: DNA topoisomerase 3 [Monoglobales bacterium]